MIRMVSQGEMEKAWCERAKCYTQQMKMILAEVCAEHQSERT